MKARHSQKQAQDRERHPAQESGHPQDETDGREGDASQSDAAAAAGADAAEAGGAPAADRREPSGGDDSGSSGDAAPALAAELEAQRDRYLRLAAEFDNYRRRSERERMESGTRAQVQLVERVLDALDDLQRVGEFDPEKTSAVSILEGVQLVERKLLRLLESAGLEVVAAEGEPFNPEVHEALATVATEKRDEDDTVADVFQKGYLFKGSLVRPARVRVWKHEG